MDHHPEDDLYQPFDHLKVTTITAVCPLSGQIELGQIFSLLPVTRISDKYSSLLKRQKNKMPYLPYPGMIWSVRSETSARGIIRPGKESNFRNAITVDMATSKKNINLKLSAENIQMCGATSIEMVVEASNLIINHLYKIQEDLDYISANPEANKAIISWMKENLKGEPFKDVYILPTPSSCGMAISEWIRESEPQIFSQLIYPEELPPMLDERIFNFYIRQIVDYNAYEPFIRAVETLKMKIITLPLKALDIRKVMVNFNYDLGFSINRWELSKNISQFPGFISRYDNTTDHSVTIQLPYELTDEMKKTRKSKKKPYHTFIVYKSGLVTQSGPNEELIEGAYIYFNRAIQNLRPLIGKGGTGNIRKIKYTPVWHQQP